MFVFSFRLSIIWRRRHSWGWTSSKWNQRVSATLPLLSAVRLCWQVEINETFTCMTLSFVIVGGEAGSAAFLFLLQKFPFKESVWTYRKSNGTTVARQQGLGGVEVGCSQGSVSEPPWVSPWWFGIPMLRLETWATDKDKWTSCGCCS